MHAFHPSCFSSVDGKSTCSKGGHKVVKNGKKAHGKLRYLSFFKLVKNGFGLAEGGVFSTKV